MLNSRRFRGHEILKIDRLAPGPDALRSTKIRDAAAGRDAGTGEDERFLGSAEIIGEGHGRRESGVEE